MARLLDNWLVAFQDFTEHMEAPRIMRTWAGLSAIASALRRKVWIDQDRFKWTPGLYIIFVGPPGVITKSTTTDMSSDLLRMVPGVKFGPNNITWQALATRFAGASESFEWPPNSGDWIPMSPITCVSRELGSLLNPKDQDLVNLFIELYDGAKTYEKETKMSGDDTIEAPWINLLGATTPAWIADNVPRSALGGGLISRCIFLYGDEKEKFVAYPIEELRKRGPALVLAHKEIEKALIHDLEHISLNLTGPYEMTPEAIKWGTAWYETLWRGAKQHYSDDKMMGYVARKQTHMHKIAMVLAASYKDKLEINLEDLQLAEQMLVAIEGSLDKVFAQIGRTDESVQAERFIIAVRRMGRIPYADAYKMVHQYFPDAREFEGVLMGAIRSGQLVLETDLHGAWLRASDFKTPLSANNGTPQSTLPDATTIIKAPNS